MLTVKLTKSSSSDPQDTGLQSVANPPYWASKAAVSLNLTIPRQERCDKAGSVASLVGPMLVPGGSPAGHEAAGGDREATPRGRVWPCAGEWHPAFRHTPAAWPGGGCSCSTVLARPVAACATIAGRVGIGGPVREPRRTGGRCPATAAPGHAPVPGGRAPLRGSASHEAEG